MHGRKKFKSKGKCKLMLSAASERGCNRRVSLSQVELKHLANHLTRWKMLGHHFSYQDLAVMALYAKHRCAASLT